jgi:hypothetical protein
MALPSVSWLLFKARATSIIELLRKERATRKNSQLATARRIAMKMGRRLSRGRGTMSVKKARKNAKIT